MMPDGKPRGAYKLEIIWKSMHILSGGTKAGLKFPSRTFEFVD